MTRMRIRTATAAAAAALLATLLAPAPAPAADPPVVNGGIVTDTNYLGPDGGVRVLPLKPSTTEVRVFSPDGGSLAYVEEPDAPGGINELWRLDAGGGVSKIAGLGDAPVYQLAWSRDGSRIAVASARYKLSGDARFFLHVVDVGTGAVTQLADSTWDGTVAFGTDGVAWSHDGERIAVQASHHQGSDILWVSAADGSVTQLTHHCDWSGWEVVGGCEELDDDEITRYMGLDMHPDGSRLLTMDHLGVYTIDTSSGAVTVLRDDGQSYTQLQWSPDGSRIAWTAVEEWGDSFDIVVYTDTVEGGDQTEVTTNVGSTWDWQPCTAASCPAFGAPRGNVRIKLTDIGYGRRWLEVDLSVRSGKKLARGVAEIPAVLQRKAGGKWAKTHAGIAYLLEPGVYQARLKRPSAGTCRIKVTFPGDYEFEPARFTSDPLRC